MRALIAFLVYAIAMPLIGALILFGVVAVAMLYGPEGRDAFRATVDEFGKAVAGIAIFAYLIGGLQALFVAIVAAVTEARRWPGRATFPAVVIAGFVAGIGFLSWMVSISNTPFLSFQSFVFLGLHIGAAIVCWLITQGIFRLLGKTLRLKVN